MKAVAGLFVSLTCVAVTSQTPVLTPGQLIYDEGRQRLLLLSAHVSPTPPEFAQLWSFEQSRWTLVPASAGPTMRTLSATAYDTRRKRVVMFGGLGNAGLKDPRADTWEWDGARWHSMSDASAGARDHHAMAYDESRGRTVMFGGVATAADATRTFPTSTSEWDGHRWTTIDAPGPSPRSGAAMAYDRARRNIVLFGGITGGSGAVTRFADTWTWDGKRWQSAGATGPAGRNGHAMAFDRRANIVVMWGGTTGAMHLDDMWQWDGSRWTEITQTEPRPSKRVGAGMIYDTARQRLVLYGGLVRGAAGVTTSNEMWEWDGAGWTRIR